VNRDELIDVIAEETGTVKTEVARMVKVITKTITAALIARDDVRLPGFGIFDVITTPAREGRNPGTGEKIQIAERRRARFKEATALKETLNPVRLTGARRQA